MLIGPQESFTWLNPPSKLHMSSFQQIFGQVGLNRSNFNESWPAPHLSNQSAKFLFKNRLLALSWKAQGVIRAFLPAFSSPPTPKSSWLSFKGASYRCLTIFRHLRSLQKSAFLKVNFSARILLKWWPTSGWPKKIGFPVSRSCSLWVLGDVLTPTEPSSAKLEDLKRPGTFLKFGQKLKSRFQTETGETYHLYTRAHCRALAKFRRRSPNPDHSR